MTTIGSKRTVAEITGDESRVTTHTEALARFRAWFGADVRMRALSVGPDGPTACYAVLFPGGSGSNKLEGWPGWCLFTIEATENPNQWVWRLERRGSGSAPPEVATLFP